MKTLHNQKGMGMAGMIATLIVFGFVSYGIMILGKEAEKTMIYNKSKNFYEQLDVIKEAILSYQVDKIAQQALTPNTFPTGFPALIGDYLPDCSHMDFKAGKCRPANYTPWGNKIDLTRQTQYISARGFMPYSRIIIPLPPVTDAFKFEHDVQVATLLRLPFAKYDETANTITWEVRRVGEELQHDGLVRRNGDNSTLTGDWDVGGNFAITNAKDVTVRNSDGSQRSLAVGIPSIVAKHNQRIDKHKCPTGLKPEIITTLKSFYNETNPRFAFSNLGALRSYAVESRTYWTIKLDYWADVQGVKTILHDGEVKAEFRCNP